MNSYSTVFDFKPTGHYFSMLVFGIFVNPGHLLIPPQSYLPLPPPPHNQLYQVPPLPPTQTMSSVHLD